VLGRWQFPCVQLQAIISWGAGYQLRIVMHNVSALGGARRVSLPVLPDQVEAASAFRDELRPALVLISDTWNKFRVTDAAVIPKRFGRIVVNIMMRTIAVASTTVMTTTGQLLKEKIFAADTVSCV